VDISVKDDGLVAVDHDLVIKDELERFGQHALLHLSPALAMSSAAMVWVHMDSSCAMMGPSSRF
jgi:hypothetical protein